MFEDETLLRVRKAFKNLWWKLRIKIKIGNIWFILIDVVDLQVSFVRTTENVDLFSKNKGFV